MEKKGSSYGAPVSGGGGVEADEEDLTWVMSPEEEYLVLAHQLEHQHATPTGRRAEAPASKGGRAVVPPASSFPSSPVKKPSPGASQKRSLTDLSSSLSRPPPFTSSRKRKSSPNEIVTAAADDAPWPSSTSTTPSTSTTSSGSGTASTSASSPALKKQKSIVQYFGFQRQSASSPSPSGSSSSSAGAAATGPARGRAAASSPSSSLKAGEDSRAGEGARKEAWWLRAARGEDRARAEPRGQAGAEAGAGDHSHHRQHRHGHWENGDSAAGPPRSTGDASRSRHARTSAGGSSSGVSAHYVDRWDKQHVRMPCSPKNVYAPTGSRAPGHQAVPSTQISLLRMSQSGPLTPPTTVQLESKWELIQSVLQQPIVDSFGIADAILSCNQSYKNKWSFGGLHAYFAEHCSAEERSLFFGSTLPFMIDLILSTKEICPEPIEFLEKQQEKMVMLSQRQIACLLANAFFCTFPGRNTKMGEKAVGQKYPSINFSNLFMSPMTGQRLGKLQCILNYFHRIANQSLVGNVSFHRRVIYDFPDWKASKTPLRQLTVRSDGTIEDDTPSDGLEVDFANKLIGGGVLGRGCVQEEIRFLISPELIVARLFCAEFDDNECLVMIGSERFNNYSGYSDSFCFDSDHKDTTARDDWGRMRTTIIAIDALEFSRWGASDEFHQRNVERELNKAYCGFLEDDAGKSTAALPLVSTGHWGCGAFGGTKELKSLLQLMAASLSRRDMLYFTFGDEVFARRFKDTHALLLQQNATVGDVYESITEYAELMEDSQGNMDLFDFLAARFG